MCATILLSIEFNKIVYSTAITTTRGKNLISTYTPHQTYEELGIYAATSSYIISF
jgi:hypothetical protein